VALDKSSDGIVIDLFSGEGGKAGQKKNRFNQSDRSDRNFACDDKPLTKRRREKGKEGKERAHIMGPERGDDFADGREFSEEGREPSGKERRIYTKRRCQFSLKTTATSL
jgi:hypothetical protein